MRRRQFITLLGGAAAWPLAARAQQAGPPKRLGVLSSANEGDFRKRFALFHDRLGQLGGVEDPGESLVEIRLRAIVEGTELTFTHSRLRDEETRRSHEQGWNGALNKLEPHFLQANEAAGQT